MCCQPSDLTNHRKAASTAATSAACMPPRAFAPYARAELHPASSAEMSQPKPAERRKEPSVQAWHVRACERRTCHWIRPRGVGVMRSTSRPSLSRRPWAREYHLETRWRLESSSGCEGRRDLRNAPARAARVENTNHITSLFLTSKMSGWMRIQ